jgi:hypothetical protein
VHADAASPNAFAQLVDAAGALLGRAEQAEAAFTAHRGGLEEMVVERARADIALAIATSAAQRATQAVSTLLGMPL